VFLENEPPDSASSELVATLTSRRRVRKRGDRGWWQKNQEGRIKVRGGVWTHGCCSGCDVITIRAHGENTAR